MDEKRLILKIKNNDRSAFKQLFEHYKDYVFNICYRMSNNPEEAEDVSQEVFIKIYRSINDFRGEAKLSSWIYRIAVNTCLKKERRKKLERWISLEFLLQDKQSYRAVCSEETPEQRLQNSEIEQIVQQAIRQLPARQKTAIVLQRYENLTYEEIARVMVISHSAVESLLHRAKQNLTKKLIPLKKSLW